MCIRIRHIVTNIWLYVNLLADIDIIRAVRCNFCTSRATPLLARVPCEDAFTENADRVAEDRYENLTGQEQTVDVNEL